MEQQAIWAIGIFLVIYALIISEKIHRTIVAMIGGLLMVVLGIVHQETAVHHIDFNTLGLLIGMMIIVSTTAETGYSSISPFWRPRRRRASPSASSSCYR